MWLWIHVLVVISVVAKGEAHCSRDSDCVHEITCHYPENVKCSAAKHCYCDREHCHKTSDCYPCRNGQVSKCGTHNTCFCDILRCSGDHDCDGILCNKGHWKKCSNRHECYCLADTDCQHHTCPTGERMVHSQDGCFCTNHTSGGSSVQTTNNNQVHRCNRESDCVNKISCEYPENVKCTNHYCYCQNERCGSHSECNHLGCGNGIAYCAPHGSCSCTMRCTGDHDCNSITCESGQLKKCFNNRACYCQTAHTSSTNNVQNQNKVDGNWGTWSSWTTCSATCGNGAYQFRHRSCNNPAPQHGGSNCAGRNKEHHHCQRHACPDQHVTTTSSHHVTLHNQLTTINHHGCSQHGDCSWLNCNTHSKCSDQHFCYCDIQCKNYSDCSSIHCDHSHFRHCSWGGHCVCAQGPEHCTKHSHCSSITCDRGHSKKCSNQHHCYCSKDSITQSQTPCQDHPCHDGEVPWPTKEGFCTCIQSHGLSSSSQVQNSKVDGNWSKWGRFGDCSATCGNGYKTRHRTCNNPSPSNGGLPCNGSSQETHHCFMQQHCSIDGGWTIWSHWSKCSATCGGGVASRVRNCTKPTPNFGGKPCEGNVSMTMTCHTNHCPVDGGWSSWSAFGQCSVTCGTGRSFRHRSCSNPHPVYNGRHCHGSSSESQTCSALPCPVNGRWSAWSSWDSCSVTCGTGTRSIHRLCNNPLPANGGKNCTGNDHITQPCNQHSCPVKNNWSGWSGWSQCTVTCGGGLQSRHRSCNNHHRHHRHSCVGAKAESMNCSVQACPINGGWSHWSNWTKCSLSCGSGIKTRNRLCNSPKPDHGGTVCVGNHSESGTCNDGSCPVHGNWSAWTFWSLCSTSCGNGSRTRHRKCDNPSPSGGGQNCTGGYSEIQACSQTACPVDGNWSSWNLWTQCSKSCGPGVRNRHRECNNPLPLHGGKDCNGQYNQTESCNISACPINGGWSAWLYTSCSATCDDGIRSRVRQCDNPAPSNGGLSCNGSANETEACKEAPCVVPSSPAPTKWVTVPLVSHQFECYQCGGSDSPCSNQELYDPQVQSSTCPSDKGYCMTDVTMRDGNPSVHKRCVDKSTCIREWLQNSSDKDYCVRLNQVKMSGTYVCHFCCTENGCNSGIVPPNNTLYNGT